MNILKNVAINNYSNRMFRKIDINLLINQIITVKRNTILAKNIWGTLFKNSNAIEMAVKYG